MIRILQQYIWANLAENVRADALSRPAVTGNPQIEDKVGSIIAAVRDEGDAALSRLTGQFDGVAVENLRVDEREFELSARLVSDDARAAMEIAIANIDKFHTAQIAAPVRVETVPGVICERVTRPVSAVGLYVPAGSAPLPSTAIMLAVPSRIAKCPVRVICTPPNSEGRADPAVVVAAKLCGVENIFKVGGAQAIAAMAYGTESIPKVDKIYGPGNAWVTAAKKAVAADADGAAQDMPAGPSEVMVIADDSANPKFVAFDLMSQAEHGPDSQAILICENAGFADRVDAAIQAALPDLPRRSTIEESLAHGACFIVESALEAVEIANRYAPEHLIIQMNNARQFVDLIDNAGSIFVGPWTPESVGDYCSGTNHVLPTYGFARSYSGLSVADFEKQLTVQELTRAGLVGLAPTVRTLARLEGLDAHAAAVTARLEANTDENSA
jgi:histidinol dehydrogenase